MEVSKLMQLCLYESWRKLLEELPVSTDEQLRYQNGAGGKVLHGACVYNCPCEVAKALIEKGCDVNEPGYVRSKLPESI
jgi:hypothetical protein